MTKIFRSKHSIFGLDDILFIQLEPDQGGLVIFKDSWRNHEIDEWENVVLIDTDEIEPLIEKWNHYKDSLKSFDRFRRPETRIIPSNIPDYR